MYPHHLNRRKRRNSLSVAITVVGLYRPYPNVREEPNRTRLTKQCVPLVRVCVAKRKLNETGKPPAQGLLPLQAEMGAP